MIHTIIIVFIVIAIATVVIFIHILRKRREKAARKQMLLGYFQRHYAKKAVESRKAFAAQINSYASDTLEFDVKGTFYRTSDEKATASNLKEKESLHFVIEPTNQYDKYAVRVYTQENIHIGYVPHEYSRGVHQNLNLLLEVYCTQVSKTHNDTPLISVMAKFSKKFYPYPDDETDYDSYVTQEDSPILAEKYTNTWQI